MPEPKDLIQARTHLARAEAAFRTEQGACDLEEGLALLQDVATNGTQQHRLVATNIANTYTRKIYSAINSAIERDQNVPEPELEHLFRILLVFDEAGFELPPDSRAVKIGIGQQLLNRYLEGHASEEKQAALRELMQLAQGGRD
jgi:hypothetical protein